MTIASTKIYLRHKYQSISLSRRISILSSFCRKWVWLLIVECEKYDLYRINLLLSTHYLGLESEGSEASGILYSLILSYHSCDYGFLSFFFSTA
jgi:hypothetical protein